MKPKWKSVLWLSTALFVIAPPLIFATGASAVSPPRCQLTNSDPDGDGYGWEYNQRCLVPGGPADLRNQIVTPTCLRSDSDSDRDGYGWENDQTCIVAVAAGPDATVPAPKVPVVTEQKSASGPVSALGVGPQCVGPTGNSSYPGLRYGDFLVQNDAWNAGASTGKWSQCISLVGGADAIAPQWSYDWLNENEVNGPEWAVKSFPEVIYGVKSASEASAAKARTGLPARYGELPKFRIDYAYSSSETKARSKVSAGRVIYGERNIAIESFFHTSCDIQRGGLLDNREFELMLWLDHGPERKPGGATSYKGDVTLDGRLWGVWTKGLDDPGYVAFFAKDGQANGSGTVNLNLFIDWVRANGAANGAGQFKDSWCMANIMFGTEIWWGEGTFRLDRFDVTRS